LTKAILLSAGYGSRLRPLTQNIPKPLLEINGTPLLSIWINKLIDAQFEKILINCFYLKEKIISFVENHEFKNHIKLVIEDTLEGTAGTLIKNINFIDEGEDLILVHADNYSEDDLKGFYKAHLNRPKNCLMTMMTFKTDKPQNCGIVLTNELGIVNKFYEKVKNPPSNIANGAIYILSYEMIREIKNNFSGSSDFSTEIIPNFMNRILTYETKKILIDIGSIASYKLANQIRKENEE
jgi:mannose-1-phosphate guanylyltransferase